MPEQVAQTLADMVGPMLSDGLELAIAERIAKIRAFRDGTYGGEPCDRCGTACALLDPWRDDLTRLVWLLCFECSGKEAVSRQREKVAKFAEGP